MFQRQELGGDRLGHPSALVLASPTRGVNEEWSGKEEPNVGRRFVGLFSASGANRISAE